MSGNRLGLTLVDGGYAENSPPERIALSLVHPRERIDIPLSAINGIETQGEISFVDQETGRPWTFSSPHIVVSLTEEIRARIYDLTRQIVGEQMEIIVGGECVAKPIVQEPLGIQPGFNIMVYELAEAHALAHRLRIGWSKAGPRAVS